MTITIDCRDEHLHALRDALELYMRCSIGQFGELAKLHAKDDVGRWERRLAVDKAVKEILTPDLAQGSSYGIGNSNVSTQAKVCYEIWKLLGGGTVGPPLNYSGIPVPKVHRI